ncbi:MAG: hypothetical protein ACPGVK_00620 [Halocynthiibacter sp.]
MRRSLLLLCLPLFLLACGLPEPKWAPDHQVAQSHYVHGGPARVTLFTVIKNSNDSGAHAGLLINGSERVLFDPAGTWHHPQLPERNDVHFGMTDPVVEFYVDYHARITFRVKEQQLDVPLHVADQLIAAVKANGAVSKAHCAKSISSILRGVPGFETIKSSYFPNTLSKGFAELGAREIRVVYDDSPHIKGLIQPPTVALPFE